ncbi:hypothetical protein LJC74_09640, partial [Eubacteriales bacterium OttesenSCG-928-A19]|nr:hypothetical protein [Eubacteriales bacterium OttesenSCG-928-A19]
MDDRPRRPGRSTQPSEEPRAAQPTREPRRVVENDAFVDTQSFPTPQMHTTTTIQRITVSQQIHMGKLNVGALLVFISAIGGTIYGIAKIVDLVRLNGQIKAAQMELDGVAGELIEAINQGLLLQAIPTPHYIAVIIAIALNWLTFFSRRPWCALAAGVAYVIAIVLYINWAFYLLPMVLLC